MQFKTILTYWNGSPSSERQIDAAVAATRLFDAHLGIAAIGYEPEMPADAYASVSGLTVSAELHDHAVADAEKLAATAAERIAAEAIRGDAFPLVTMPAGLAHAFGRRARYVDLVVLSKPVGDDYYQGARRTFEGALFHGDAAVLICPEGATLAPTRVMIAWDGGPSALRSVRRAYPLLAAASDVEIALVDGEADQMHGAEELAVMLSRHGLSPVVSQLASEGMSDAAALRRHQVESGADLVVSGAYGHSRFRELLLGGVTRELPEMTDVPIFMVH